MLVNYHMLRAIDGFRSTVIETLLYHFSCPGWKAILSDDECENLIIWFYNQDRGKSTSQMTILEGFTMEEIRLVIRTLIDEARGGNL